MNQGNKRSGFGVMVGLIGMIKPLLGIMLIAILMGCVGNLMATFITVLGGYGFLGVALVNERHRLLYLLYLQIQFLCKLFDNVHVFSCSVLYDWSSSEGAPCFSRTAISSSVRYRQPPRGRAGSKVRFPN